MLMNEIKRRTILLIEDNNVDAEVARLVVQKSDPSSNVIRVRDGQEALDYIFRMGPYADREDENPDVVLLDLCLPKVDGIDVLRALKSNELTKNIPVIALTGSAQESDVGESYLVGVNSYLLKPLGASEFTDVVSQIGFFRGMLDKLPIKTPAPGGRDTRSEE